MLVGNRLWMSDNNIELTDSIENEIQSYEEHGQTVVLVAINGEQTRVTALHVPHCVCRSFGWSDYDS